MEMPKMEKISISVQPICLLRRKNGLYQKLFAFG